MQISTITGIESARKRILDVGIVEMCKMAPSSLNA